jgi:hypothetical protein
MIQKEGIPVPKCGSEESKGKPLTVCFPDITQLFDAY